MESKGQSQFDCRAVCNAQKTMPVRLFNSIFFAYYSLSFFSVRLTQQIENPYIIRVMIHQPASSYGIRKNKKKKKKKKKKKYRSYYYFSDACEILRLRNLIVDAYIQRTGQSYTTISRDLERDSFMTPTESVEYGIIDEVVYPLEIWEY